MQLSVLPPARAALPSAQRLLMLLVALIFSLGLLPSAHAQSAANGKALYDTNPFGGKACGNSTCHKPQTGTTVSTTNKINKGANNASLILSAISGNTGGMNVYTGLTSGQAADIAYYLANLSAASSSPVAGAAPTTLSFGSVTLGSSSASQTVTLSNTGTAALSLSSFASNSAAFVVTAGTCATGGSVAAGGSCTVTVKFTPAAAGAASGTLTFTHNASPATTTVSLSGTGAAVATAPAASLSASSLNFGSTTVATTSAAQTVTLSNTGTAALSLSALSTGAPFTISGGTCAAGGSVAAGSSCTVAVSFSPSAVGAASGTLNFVHNASPSTSSVALSGTGAAAPVPAASLSATSVTFASTAVGASSAAQTVTLTNSGSANLALTAVSNGGSTVFPITGGSCAAGTSLAAGASCTVTMSFNPGATGTASGMLTISHNASPATSTVSLNGTGTAAPAPSASLSSSSLTFAATTVGSTSAAQTVTLTNGGNASLAISTIASSSGAFTVAGGTCANGGSVLAGASCTVSLTFKPTATGAASGTLTISHNASPATSSVSLNGSGTAVPAPVAAVTPTTLSFSQVVGGTSSSQTVTVSNSGNAALVLGTVTLGGAQSADFAQAGGSCTNGLSLAAGANCTVLVTYSPTTATSSTASLSIAHNAAGSPSTVSLNGTGTASPQPVVSLNKSALTFTSQSLGTTSAAQTVTITNAGQAALVLSAINLSGTDSADYTLGGSCAAGTTVAIGANCALTVTFSPSGSTLGTRSASLSITSNAAAASTIGLSGTASAVPAPVASLTPTTLTYSQVVGTTSASQTVTVSNTGNAPLALSAITIGGAQASSFAQAAGSTCTSTSSIAAGASCTLLITFTPSAASAAAGTLTVAHNAIGGSSTVTLNGTGTPAPQPLIALNNNALTFGSQAVATSSAALTLTVSNPGQAALVLSTLSIAGANAADFALTGTGVCTPGQSLAVGATCTVQLKFTPSAAAALGARTASLSIASNASGAAPIVALTGTAIAAPAPAMTLAPAAPQDFGAVTLGATPSTRIVTVSNTGTAVMGSLSASVSGAGFSISGNTCGSTLAAGSSCDLTLRFAPAAVGAASGVLSVASNATGSPKTQALTGTGDAVPLPVLAWTNGAVTYAFSDTFVGAPSAGATYTMANNGPGAVTISAVAMSGTNAADFVVDASACTSGALAAGASCDLHVRFSPADMGPRAARMSVQSNGSNPAAVELSGNGVSLAGAALSLSSDNLIVPALTGATVPLTLTNSGTATVTISSLSFDSGAFKLRQSCGTLPLVLEPNGSCQLDVSLAADAPSSSSDTLTVTTSPGTVSKRLSVNAAPVANNVGAGGCSLADPEAARFDPVLLLMAALAFGVLWLRRSRG